MKRVMTASGTLTKNAARQPQQADEHAADRQPDGRRHHARDHQAAEHGPGRSVEPGGGGPPPDEEHRRRVAGRGADADQHAGDDQRGEVRREPADEPAEQDKQRCRRGTPGAARTPPTASPRSAGRSRWRGRAPIRAPRSARRALSSPRAIGTSAVAISELLTGLSAEPMNIGVTNRQPNAPCAAAWAVSCCVVICSVYTDKCDLITSAKDVGARDFPGRRYSP